MSYEPIDDVILNWVARHALHLYTTHREEEVRSVDLVGTNGERCQLWVDTPDQFGNVQVHVWDYMKRRQDYETAITELPQCLETAYSTAVEWIA
ncbi:MAG: hypothetical protein ABR501_11405 [Pyrinomonadaceae bacterium]